LKSLLIEIIGWISTGLFLFSIIIPNRRHLHLLGVVTSIATGVYAYSHGATAIWVKWVIAFFFHAYMFRKMSNEGDVEALVVKSDGL
jgi:hypothetical protein